MTILTWPLPLCPAGTVPPSSFGKDHFSVLAYAETRCVDFKAQVDPNHLRTNLERTTITQMRRTNPGKNYPSNIRGGIVQNHDDWDCLGDLIAADWLTASFGAGSSEQQAATGTYSLTPSGAAMAARLRAHKAAGGNFAGFEA